MSYLEKYVFLKENTNSTMGNRVLAEIGYAHKLSKVNSCKFDDVISKVTEFLMEKYHADGNLTDAAAKEAESMLSVISGEAKKYRIMCTAHAHIDMNWMWDYPETVAITTDTFRTVLSLMKDFPGFKFSQSQASVYRIVEEHEPEMLDEIRKMVAAGRWEAVASTWVEADKNLTSGESQARHVLYTKRYLGTLLDISPESIQVDFEPDTFGHSANVPEILSQGGIRYYYHCRGYDGYNIYRWKAESGASLLVYREPVWYNEKIDSDMALFVPEFCEANGIDTLLKVYGVGNHGGGPTRRDLERITEMQTWPVFPEIVFGTYAEFFDHLEKTKKEFPEVTGELNYVFTGCYTSQSRIKKANKTSENRLVDSEALCSMASIGNNRRYNSAKFFGAWERVMFNQFHDILPGSGVIDTREFAMGNYQYAIAFANSEAADAIRTLTKDIDTSWISPQGQDEAETNSEGAGVGFDLCRHRIPATETGRGLNRIKHIFNPTQFRRKEPVETTIWDWPGDLKRLIVTDHKGNRIAHQLLDKAGIDYWAHNYVRILIDADILPYGFSTYHITQKEMEDIPISLPNWERLMDNDSFVLENEKICVRFNSQNLALESLFDKEI
ncbi:MAG: alpha-mannosidase, partial [Clostridia bacterium]|nr:alpha-mannosidase [Clostridia bacterium]